MAQAEISRREVLKSAAIAAAAVAGAQLANFAGGQTTEPSAQLRGADDSAGADDWDSNGNSAAGF